MGRSSSAPRAASTTGLVSASRGIAEFYYQNSAMPMASPLFQARGSLREVGAVAFPDQGSVEGEHLAHHAAGLVAVVDDHRAHADVDGQHLEAKVGDEADALGPVLPQGLLALDNAVPAE